MRGEEIWNQDLLDLISKEIKSDYPEYKVSKCKVLKDVFLYRDDKGPALQFGFVDQDIVIYKETLDIEGLGRSVPSIFLHNLPVNQRSTIVIPKLICELKYNGITSHGLITYSQYASNIKSIFPECSYCLLMRYQKGSSSNKLLRHGPHIDKIMFLEEGASKKQYAKGDFGSELQSNKYLSDRFTEFVDAIKNILVEKETFFSR